MDFDNIKIEYMCPICGSMFQVGPHIYEGGPAPGFEHSVCRKCYNPQTDEFSPGAEAKIRDKKGT